MARSMQLNLSQHRPWEDWANIVLGALIMLAPAIAIKTVTGPVLFSGLAVGIVILAMTLFEVMNRLRVEEVAQFVAGTWLMVSIFVIDYGAASQLRFVNLALGALVAILAIYEFWQDSSSRAA